MDADLDEEEFIVDDHELKKRLYVQESKIHGQGVFARCPFETEDYLGNYHGPITHENDVYVLWVEDDQNRWYGIDGKNLLRYLNHSATPNTEFDGDELYALRPIQPDEEITFDYGEEFRAYLETEKAG